MVCKQNQMKATEQRKRDRFSDLSFTGVFVFNPPPPISTSLQLISYNREKIQKKKKTGVSKRWASLDVKLFTNNQSESEKMSLAGESSGGRWGSGTSVWRRVGMGGVMSASGIRSTRGRWDSRDLGCGFFFCVAKERSSRERGERKRGEPGGLIREEEKAAGGGWGPREKKKDKNIMKKLKPTQVGA